MGNEQRVEELASKWDALAAKAEHSKDRDRHWVLEERFSYGMPPVYAVVHQGYLYDRIEEEFDTREAALAALRQHLERAIAGLAEGFGE